MNQKQNDINVYSDSSTISSPFSLLGIIFHDIWKYRELSWLLFTRDMKSQFRQSYFGYLWLLLPILSTTLVWIFLESNKLVNVTPTTLPYPLFVLLGTLVWTTFAAAVNSPASSFQAGQSIFLKLNLPPEIFLVSGVYKLLFDILIRSTFILPVCLLYNQFSIIAFLILPLILIVTILLGFSIGFLLLPLGSLYHDFTRLTSLALSFGMYLTPIVYPPPTSGIVSYTTSLNPITPLVTESRSVFTNNFGADYPAILAICLVSLLLLAVNMTIFRSTLPHITERMGM